MECPECKEKLHFYDSLAFHNAKDYLGELTMQYIVGGLFAVIVASCFSYSEELGLVVLIVGSGLFYYHLTSIRTIWLCKSCNKKYVGKKLAIYNG